MKFSKKKFSRKISSGLSPSRHKPPLRTGLYHFLWTPGSNIWFVSFNWNSLGVCFYVLGKGRVHSSSCLVIAINSLSETEHHQRLQGNFIKCICVFFMFFFTYALVNFHNVPGAGMTKWNSNRKERRTHIQTREELDIVRTEGKRLWQDEWKLDKWLPKHSQRQTVGTWCGFDTTVMSATLLHGAACWSFHTSLLGAQWAASAHLLVPLFSACSSAGCEMGCHPFDVYEYE